MKTELFPDDDLAVGPVPAPDRRSAAPARTFADRPGARAASPRPRPRPEPAPGESRVVPRRPRSIPLRIKVPVGTLTAIPVPPRDLERVDVSATLSSCRHCLRRRAQQTRCHRLRLRRLDLFEWAGRQGKN